MKRPRRRHESTAYHESAHAVRSRVLGQMPGRSRAARTKERLDSRKATQESRSAKMGQPAMRELTSVVLEMERQGKRLYRMLRVGRLNTDESTQVSRNDGSCRSPGGEFHRFQ